MLPNVALTSVDPLVIAVTKPVPSIVATDASIDAQVTCDVMSCELPSLQMPVAVSCAVVLTTAVGDPGVMLMVARIGVTARDRDPLTVPIVATIFTVPLATAVTIPPAATVAMPVALEDHVAWVVRSLVLESLYVPVAVNCRVPFTGIEAPEGATAIDTRRAATGGGAVDEPPQPISTVAMTVVSANANVLEMRTATVFVTDPPGEHGIVWPRLRPDF